MNNTTNLVTAIMQQIQAVNGIPKVLEALWDGDTEGWHLCLKLYYQRRTWWFKEIIQPVLSQQSLGVISLGGDIWLFGSEVPPWPEALLAKELGQVAKEEYNLTFYFPSEEPDNDCPSWLQRHLAIACMNCGKLIIPTDSPYLPKDRCYPCYLKLKHLPAS